MRALHVPSLPEPSLPCHEHILQCCWEQSIPFQAVSLFQIFLFFQGNENISFMGKKSLGKDKSKNAMEVFVKRIYKHTWDSIQETTQEQRNYSHSVLHWLNNCLKKIWWIQESFILTKVPGVQFFFSSYFSALPFSALYICRVEYPNTQIGTSHHYVH